MRPPTDMHPPIVGRLYPKKKLHVCIFCVGMSYLISMLSYLKIVNIFYKCFRSARPQKKIMPRKLYIAVVFL